MQGLGFLGLSGKPETEKFPSPPLPQAMSSGRQVYRRHNLVGCLRRWHQGDAPGEALCSSLLPRGPRSPNSYKADSTAP